MNIIVDVLITCSGTTTKGNDAASHHERKSGLVRCRSLPADHKVVQCKYAVIHFYFLFLTSRLSQTLCTLDDLNQEFNGLDFSDGSRNNVKDLSALSFQMNRFEDDVSDKVDSEFPSNSDSSRNPFLLQNDSPKKSSTKLFHKSTEMMMGGGKGNKYDVFKNEMVVNGQANAPMPVQQQNIKSKTEASPDLFKDFAIAAFSEFKVEKSPMIHEFSNRLSDQRNPQHGHQMMKVISKTPKIL